MLLGGLSTSQWLLQTPIVKKSQVKTISLCDSTDTTDDLL